MTRFLSVVVLLAGCFSPVAEPCRSKLRCPADAGGDACSVGSTRECGSAVGICKPGRQTCGPNGTWGRCSGGVEPGVEVCDGKDNNCDGVVDEGVAKMCPLQKGVCAGAAAGCGGDGGCVIAYGAAYELIEGKCDGLDNDCDGLVDRSGATNISQSPGVVSRKPVAVRVPNSTALLVLYEEGPKLAARVLRADGTLSDAVPPAVTVEAATRAYAPAVAANGSLIVAAWVEEIGMTRRVMVASLDPATGRSNLMAAGALLAMTATNPTEVAVAVDEAAGRLLLAVVDTGGLRLSGFSSTLPPPMGSPSFTAEPYDPLGRRVMVASAGGGSFTFAYDRTDGRVERAWVNASGMRPFEPLLPTGHDPAFFARDAGPVSYFLAGSATSKQLFTAPCTITTSTVTCSTAVPLNAPGDFDLLDVSGAELAAWQQSVSAPEIVAAWLGRPDAGMRHGPGRRPAAVATPTHAVVFFDTESVVSTLVASDDVYVTKTCR